MSEDATASRLSPIERVAQLLTLIQSGYEPSWMGLEPRGDGTHPWPWVEYDPRVQAGLQAATELAGGADRDYLDHIEDVHLQPVLDRSRRQLATWFTWTSRGERFVTGHIAETIASGELEQSLLRLLALVAEP